MEIGGLSDCNYCWHAGGGWGGGGSTDGGTRGGPGHSPGGVQGRSPGGGLQGAEPPDCHETNLKCFMNKFCDETFFFSFCRSMNSLYTCSYRCRDFTGNNLLPMILFASAFNSCMIEFSIPDFIETSIKNIMSLFLSFSNTERREVAFRTLWFFGRYCSQRGERVPLSLYIPRTRKEDTFVAVPYFHFMTLHFTDAKVNFPNGFLLFQPIKGAKVN